MTFTNKSFQDLYFTIKFKDGSEWSDRFVRDTFLDKRMDIVPTNRFINTFLPGPDTMTMTSIKRAMKAWLDANDTVKEISSMKWETA